MCIDGCVGSYDGVITPIVVVNPSIFSEMHYGIGKAVDREEKRGEIGGKLAGVANNDYFGSDHKFTAGHGRSLS